MALQSDTPDAWNPGLTSDIPGRLLPETTLFRAENALVTFTEARELSDLTGLPVLQFVSLKPERLVLHELLVRVTADLSVADDQAYEVLGINLRQMVSTIENAYIRPQMSSILESLDERLQAAQSYIHEQLMDCLFAESVAKATVATGATGAEPPINSKNSLPASTGRLSRLASWLWSPSIASEPVSIPRSGSDDHDLGSTHETAVAKWRELQCTQIDDAMQMACLSALVDIVESIVRHRGRLVGDQALIEKLVINRLRMGWGAEIIAQLVVPLFNQAVQQETYRLLPAQAVPLIMNVKGASASGKSTIRPQQRVLSQRLEIAWEDFALISPDYWRKSLLDYDSLGTDYLYGAMLTGQELAIIDAKLDAHMARKAANNLTTHLLIDRFRFDSFVLEPHRVADSTLLTRFGQRIFMFFMITPPTETVERAWKRGLKTGRYKAVDDLLYHNIEAYKGMPDLFFSWVNAEDKKVHFEFLDNDVPEGTLPRTVAYGWNGAMVVLLPDVLMAIDHYTKVNTGAQRPEDVLPEQEAILGNGVSFIERCIRRVNSIVFARVEGDKVRVYAQTLAGKLVWWDSDYASEHESRDGIGQLMTLFGVGSNGTVAPQLPAPSDAMQIDLQHEQQFTVGRWDA